jgi:ribonuclease BN (tRNA processing enzyme)
MRLTVLGCSGSVPSLQSPASGYLLESGDTRIVLDFGNGVLAALQRFADPFAINAVLLSHLHPDHCADVAALAVLRRYHPRPPYNPAQWPMPVLAPAEAAGRLAALYAPNAAERADTDLSDVFEFFPLTDKPIQIGSFEIRAVPVVHVCPAWGFRIAAEGRVFGYSGDTAACVGLTELGRDADLLLSEASWPHSTDRSAGVHLSGAQAAQAARDAGARRLLLTHVQPWWECTEILAEAREVFDGPTELAEAGRSYDV